LRDLQAEQALAAILAALPTQRPKLLVKLAPDLAEPALRPIIDTCIGCGVDGLVISNTTIARPPLRSRLAGEAGGLSGAPLFARSTAMLARAYCIAAGRLTLIGVGGVATGAQALTKLKAGASLVQLYTAFAYAGPALIGQLHRDLAEQLRREGFATPHAAIGVDAVRLSEPCP
jgi:dihydroorotate dehydrogenase